MPRYLAKLIVAATASGALSATAIAQTPPAETSAPSSAQTAQPAPPSTSTAPAAATAVEIDDRQIRSFALALVEIDKIQRKYSPRIEAAGEQERPALQQEANARMTTAVEAQGLDAQTFNAISASASESPELETKIRQEVAKVRSQAPSGR